MQLIKTYPAYNQEIFKQLRAKVGSVRIATYGIYAGIDHEGQHQPHFKSDVRTILEALKAIPNVKILVGIYRFMNCRGMINCAECEKNFLRTLIRTVNHVDAYPQFEWRGAQTLHLKCITFDGDKQSAIVGGRNLTGSDWADLSMLIDGAEAIAVRDYYDQLWDKCSPLDGKLIDHIAKSEGISPAGFKALTRGL